MQLPSVLPDGKAQKLKGDGGKSGMGEGEMIGLVSMLSAAPLNPKIFQALIYYCFMYPSFPLTSGSKIFEVCSHTV